MRGIGKQLDEESQESGVHPWIANHQTDDGQRSEHHREHCQEPSECKRPCIVACLARAVRAENAHRLPRSQALEHYPVGVASGGAPRMRATTAPAAEPTIVGAIVCARLIQGLGVLSL